MKALIDGDSIVYRSGFASDSTVYTVDTGFGKVEVFHKRDAYALCDELEISRDIIVEETRFEPVENCLHTIKITIQKILDACNTKDYAIFISGSDNFRNDVAVTSPYKGNRDTAKRPHWYNEMREYLISMHGAVVADNEEADDMLGYNQTDTTILCALDKDLNMIPGKHYNWDRDEQYEVDDIEALQWFYTQLITGDPSDNIEGLSEKAPRRRTYKTAPLRAMLKEKDMLDYVFEGYALKYCDDAEARLLEMGRLLWIRREPKQIWDIPNV